MKDKQRARRFRKAANELSDAHDRTGRIHVDDLGKSNIEELRQLRDHMGEWESKLEMWADELEEEA